MRSCAEVGWKYVKLTSIRILQFVGKLYLSRRVAYGRQRHKCRPNVSKYPVGSTSKNQVQTVVLEVDSAVCHCSWLWWLPWSLSAKRFPIMSLPPIGSIEFWRSRSWHSINGETKQKKKLNSFSHNYATPNCNSSGAWNKKKGNIRKAVIVLSILICSGWLMIPDQTARDGWSD